MRWKSHVRFGGRPGETDHRKRWHGAPVRSHLANTKLEVARRRTNQEVLGHRGRKDDPLFRARRLLAMAHERLDHRGNEKLAGLLKAGDPKGEVRMSWLAKESVREIYSHSDADLARTFVDELVSDMTDTDMPPEVRSLGRTLKPGLPQSAITRAVSWDVVRRLARPLGRVVATAA